MSEQPQEQDPREVVYMTHPDTQGTGSATREAFELHWKGLGWKLETTADADQVAHEQRLRQVTATLGIADLERARKAELVEVAGQLGRTVPPGATNAELRELVENPVSPEDGTTNAGSPPA